MQWRLCIGSNRPKGAIASVRSWRPVAGSAAGGRDCRRTVGVSGHGWGSPPRSGAPGGPGATPESRARPGPGAGLRLVAGGTDTPPARRWAVAEVAARGLPDHDRSGVGRAAGDGGAAARGTAERAHRLGRGAAAWLAGTGGWAGRRAG